MLIAPTKASEFIRCTQQYLICVESRNVNVLSRSQTLFGFYLINYRINCKHKSLLRGMQMWWYCVCLHQCILCIFVNVFITINVFINKHTHKFSTEHYLGVNVIFLAKQGVTTGLAADQAAGIRWFWVPPKDTRQLSWMFFFNLKGVFKCRSIIAQFISKCILNLHSTL